MSSALFPFAEYWWAYAGFTAGVLALLALDLGVFHRATHEVGPREAVLWSLAWLTLALAFDYGLYRYALWRFARDPPLLALPGFDPAAAAARTALEFLTGFIVEKSLSVDNIFVFVLIFAYFGIPARYQHRVLFFGIVGALAFRALFWSGGKFPITVSLGIIAAVLGGAVVASLLFPRGRHLETAGPRPPESA